MKRAMSLVDGKDWDATEFGAREESWRRSRREHLTCLACGEPAFFRAESGDRRPTFGARHNSTCTFVVRAPWSVFKYLQ
ncbi:hypothetical protein [Arthrobacter rhizosphaerae]|uniref:hypothetical protein n=1 Tax=Arthrobacter rhizosphaerae TaxID=2855490 RepID=UPI001FF5B7C8|nr:hypothetical protein [Arthrobacter rhizosphaerae]